jgi:flavorubredoxin/flavin reductase (DIM6/NTAB) family NADH-FMN oxidoreductase RutF
MLQAPPARDLTLYPLDAETLLLRSRSWQRLRFEIEYGLERGTTSNSYLIRGDRALLINPPGESFAETFLQELQARQPLEQLDYVLLGHFNPNRVSTLKQLLRLAPHLTVVCSNPGAQILQKLYIPDEGETDLPPLTLQVIRSEESFDLGQGHVLQCVLTPTPRWPGGLCVFDPKTGVLFSDKFFGAHLCRDQVFDEGWTVCLEDWRYYYDCLMAPQGRQVQAALDKFAELPVQIYAPSHGPLVRYGLTELTKHYRNWGTQQAQRTQMVALLYASAYGSTAAIAQAIAQGLSKAGVRVESFNCEVASLDEIRAALEACDAFVIGSPTLGGHAPTPIQTALGTILSVGDRTKPAGVFGSYGWSGEAIDLLESKLRDAGFRFGFEPIRVQFKPTDLTLKACEEAGTDLGQLLVRQKKRSERQAAKLSDSEGERTALAVGRLLGSLCVLTAKKGTVRSGMLASWVSQATFNPPGLTIAVAKDRAVEALTYSGDRFVLNILAEGRDLPLQKHFLKPFGPGEDRFAGIGYQDSECSAPILKDALAWLQCRVADRMECGDHWVIYVVVEQGDLNDAEGRTAVHYRKTGNFY